MVTGTQEKRFIMTISASKKETVVRLLTEGESLFHVQNETQLSYRDVKQIADEIGWQKKWRKIANYQREDLYLMIFEQAVEKNMNLQQIGDFHKFSRERARQILKEMGLNVKSIKDHHISKIKDSVYDLQKDGLINDAETATKLDVPISFISKAKSKMTVSQFQEIEEARGKRESAIKKQKSEQKKQQVYDKMKLAIELWPTHHVKDIAKKYGKTEGAMWQDIMRYGKKYGWFPYKYEKR